MAKGPQRLEGRASYICSIGIFLIPPDSVLFERIVEDRPLRKGKVSKETSLLHSVLLSTVAVFKNVDDRIFEKREPQYNTLSQLCCFGNLR